jgi:hypothetical protein
MPYSMASGGSMWNLKYDEQSFKKLNVFFQYFFYKNVAGFTAQVTTPLLLRH